jgi:hypothetical protein
MPTEIRLAKQIRAKTGTRDLKRRLKCRLRERFPPVRVLKDAEIREPNKRVISS